MAVTLRDVAAMVGVHPATVSRVMNPETAGMVSEVTAEKVRTAAKQLGYAPNPIAQSLKRQRSTTLGIVVPDITNPLFPPVIRGFEAAVESAGYNVLIGNTDNLPDREAAQFRDMRARRVEGVLVATARLHDAAVERLVADGVPVVMVNRVANDCGASSVVSDDAGGIRRVVRLLHDLGHRRIAHIAGPRDTSTGVARLRAFQHAVEDLGLEADEALIAPDNAFQVASGHAAMVTLLDRADATAVVAANDLLAIGACDALAERGLSCPGDVSVTGFNDLPLTDRLAPPLTTVRVSHTVLGREAGQLLVQMLTEKHAGEPMTVKSVSLPTTLLERGSTGPVRG